MYEQEITLSEKEEAPEEKVEVEETKEEKVEETTKSKIEAVKLFSKLFESREMAHVYHLQVKGDMGSHASHTALNDYYDGILDIIDTLVEIYQGQYDIVEGYENIDTTGTKTKDPIDYFKELAQFVKDCRFEALSKDDTHLQNIVDEVVALIYKTLYKLRFTK